MNVLVNGEHKCERMPGVEGSCDGGGQAPGVGVGESVYAQDIFFRNGVCNHYRGLF